MSLRPAHAPPSGKTPPMAQPGVASSQTLSVNEEAFLSVERLAAYEIANALLSMQIELQRSLGLRAEEQQVFLAIAVATVQRFARTASPGADHMRREPLPRELAGHISRRRIAEALGLPFETVRRHVARMKERGLLVEGKKGQLSTPGGTLARLGEDDVPIDFARRFTSVVRALQRMGAM